MMESYVCCGFYSKFKTNKIPFLSSFNFISTTTIAFCFKFVLEIDISYLLFFYSATINRNMNLSSEFDSKTLKNSRVNPYD